jgi:transposase
MSPVKQYREWSPRQSHLFPPALQDWLPEDDLSYFILDLVESLDLSAIERVIHGKDPRGTRPYHPRMMVALLLYGYCIGVMSSRKIEAATHRDVAFRMLSGGSHPDH